MSRGPRAMIAGSTLCRIRRFARRSDGAAGIELGFGAAALLTVSMLCFDLHSVVSVDTAGARSAVTLAEFVSREIAPEKDPLPSLGEFLQRQEFGVPTHAAFAISAVQRPTGEDRAVILWTDSSIRFGDDAVTAELAGECEERASDGWHAILLGPPAESGMTEGEVVLVAEVCARPSRQGLIASRLFVGDSYHMHILPARDQDNPPASPA